MNKFQAQFTKGCSKDGSVRDACSHSSTSDCPRMQVFTLSIGVLQINCCPELPCPTCLWWLLLKKSLKIPQHNIPGRDVTSTSLPKLPSHCNTGPRCKLSIWWFPGFNYAKVDRVLGWLALQKQSSCPPPLSPNTTLRCLSGDPQGEAHYQSWELSDTHLRILCIVSALRCCLTTRSGVPSVHNYKNGMLRVYTRQLSIGLNPNHYLCDFCILPLFHPVLLIVLLT